MKTITSFRHQCVLGLKRVLYGQRGEPYRIDGRTLRYLPGTRPVRLRFATSSDVNARYDALQVAWLLSHLADSDTAIDIGAHYGTYSILMAAKCGRTGNLVAFEPDPYAREVLKRNIALNHDLKPPIIEPSACSDELGEATLFSWGGNARSTLAAAPNADQSETITVPVITLDAYSLKHQLVPQCVKIDAEGAEIRILKGAKRILSSNANVVCELHPFAWPRFGNTLAELKDIAAAAGRRIRYLDQTIEVGEQAAYGTVALERP